jgi:glycosyltransferase involved in cell wall biosynthesis
MRKSKNTAHRPSSAGRFLSDEIALRTRVQTEDPPKLKEKPELSVLVVTYNHATFINECILSIIQQCSTFRVEIIVCDDASTDGTWESILELAAKHKNIRPYQGSRENNISLLGGPSGRYNAFKGLTLCDGKYLAWMDGDDYWHDKRKLQKPYDAMESNPHWTMCFTLGNLAYDDGMLKDSWRPNQREFSGFEYLTRVSSRNLASSRVFKTTLFHERLPEWLLNSFSDQFQDLWAGVNGTIGWIDSNSTTYNVHSGGIWQGAQRTFKKKLAFSRLQSLLQYGGHENWIRKSWLSGMFLNYLRELRSITIREEFGVVSQKELVSFGAMKNLASFRKILVLAYYWYTRLRITLSRRKGSTMQ